VHVTELRARCRTLKRRKSSRTRAAMRESQRRDTSSWLLLVCSFLSSFLQTGDSKRNPEWSREISRECRSRRLSEDGRLPQRRGNIFIRHFGRGENGKKIYDLRKTLIIPIHKARSILARRYAAVGHASGLIKNDDRKGRKLRGAYRPINSTSASICLSPSPSLSFSLSFSLPLSLSLSLSLTVSLTVSLRLPHFLSVPILPFPDFPPLLSSPAASLHLPPPSPCPSRTRYVPQNPCNYRRPSTN